MILKNILILTIAFSFVGSMTNEISAMAKSSKHQLFSQDILTRNTLEKEANRLCEAGDFDGAMDKYREALNPKLRTYDWEAGNAHGGIMRIYRYWEQYDEALKELDWFLAMNKEKYEPDRRELLALKNFKSDQNKDYVYKHIDYLKSTYPTAFPPVGNSSFLISTILRLYDTIGDPGAGIAFVDVCMTFLREQKKNRGENYEIYDQIKTAEEATDCLNKRTPDWRACKLIREYLLVREAFEQDKRDGTKGRATKALIQSTYFPW